MTDKQEALYRTFKPLIFGSLVAATIYGLLQLFTSIQLAIGVATIGAIYLLILVYQMNLDSVRRERQKDTCLDD